MIVASIGLSINFFAFSASAAVVVAGFTFVDTVPNNQNKTYYVDVVEGTSIATAAGKWNVEANIGFYGSNLSGDTYYSNNIYKIAHLKIRPKGQNTYLGTLGEVNYSSGPIIGSQTGEEYQSVTQRTLTNGFAVDPGEYVIDAVIGQNIVSSVDVCMPSFVSSSGITVGNTICPGVLGTGITPPAGSSAGTGSSTPNQGVPGPYTGKFTFPTGSTGVVPDVACTTTDCTFKIKIKGTTTGNVATVLNFYPQADRDAGGTKGFTSNGFSYSVKAYSGKTYNATITIPTADLKAKMDPLQAPDRKYYVSFVNASDLNQESGRKYFDFAAYIPAGNTATSTTSSSTANGNQAAVTFTITSLKAPATTATIVGTLKTNIQTSQKLDLYVWPVGGTPQKIQTTGALAIDPQGTPLSLTVGNLQASTSYNFKVTLSGGGTEIYDGTFSTNISKDQAGALEAVNGVCGTATTNPWSVTPNADLCTSGVNTTVSGTSDAGWDWVCEGSGGGSNSGPCHAESLTSQAKDTNSDPTGPADAPNDPTNPKDEVTPDKPGGFLQNPFKTLDSFPKIIKAVVNNIVLPIAVPFIGVMIIYSGFLFVVAGRRGDPNGIKKAKETFTYTMIGAALVLGAFVIANALQGTLNDLVSTRYETTHKQTNV